MSRRSQRLKLPDRSNTGAAPSTSGINDLDEGHVAKPARQNGRTTKKARPHSAPASKRGKLQQMLDMPLDVIMEICGHLHPRDLLHLARSSKDLRDFFMSRNSALFWKAARLALTSPCLPPCPTDLSEPAYANLMFDSHCHNCLKQNCQDVYWTERVRLCKACYDSLNILVEDCDVIFDREAQQLIRPRHITDVMPSIDGAPTNRGSFYAPHLQRFVSSLKSTPPNDLEKFLSLREKLVAEDASSLARYSGAAKSLRSLELDQVRKARKEGIIEKLEEAGFQEEVNYMLTRSWESRKRFHKLPEVRKAQALTPRIWNNIKEAVITFMEGVKERREYYLAEEILIPRLKILERTLEDVVRPLNPCKFSVLEAASCIPEIYHRLNPTVTEFDDEELRHFLQEFIPQYLEQRTTNAKESYIKETRERLGLSASADPFDLAFTTYFVCPQCRQNFAPPHVFYHQCHSYEPDKPEWMSQHYYDILNNSCFGIIRCRFWPASILSAESTKQAETVIEACGFDVRTATAAELDDADVRILCTQSVSRGTPIMNWRTAALFRFAFYSNKPLTFTRATEKQASATRQLEPKACQAALLKRDECFEFGCSHCECFRDEQTDKALIKKHLLNSHGIAEPAEADWVDFSTSPCVPEPIYIVVNKKVGVMDTREPSLS
ncbi:hypothetical protein BDY19DRAFT_993936 [Irpex rosettiformis]|uniref:Uncharacterized protein n=1 Tax=Irpex rosettiformis TaxID=378272 RepID=A0ACB8U339_9APHY|nr:hypothetical protein BDY19DRAFT_993936 [Irpex rosettiformis]